MRGLRILAVVLALAALALVLILRSDDGPTAIAPELPITSDAAPASSPERPIEAAEPAPARETAARTSVPGPRPGTPAELTGRLLLQNGQPAHGAELRLSAQASADGPNRWTDLQTMSSPEGRFEFRFDPSAAREIELVAKLATYEPLAWRWTELAAGSTTRLEDATFRGGGALRARVVDATGRTLTQEWTVHAEGGAPVRQRLRAAIDPGSGWALIEGLPPGPVKTQAQAGMSAWATGPMVDVRAGETAEVDIPYTGPDLSRTVVLRVSTQPCAAARRRVETAVLIGNGLERTVTLPSGLRSFLFSDLEPGSYSIRIEHPLFEPWQQDGLMPGTSVTARLRGNAAVQLAVVDAANDAPIARYGLDTRLEDFGVQPNVCTLLKPGSAPPPDGRFESLLPLNQTLLVSSEGYMPCEVPVPGLAPYEARTVVARLTRGATLRGYVHSAGTPMPHAAVRMEVIRPTEPGRAAVSSTAEVDTRQVQTGPDGRFAVPRLSDGPWRLRVQASPFLIAELDVRVPEQTAEELEVALPASATLAGRVLAPEGARFDGLELLALPRELAPSGRPLHTGHHPDTRARIQPEGWYRTPLLPVGEVDVWVRLPDVRLAAGPSMGASHAGGRIPLGSLRLPPGETHQDFDLRERFPGAIEVTVHAGGEPAAGLGVTATSIESNGWAASTALDAGGRGRLGPLPPGTYKLSVGSPSGLWNHVDGRTFEVRANATTQASLQAPIATGVLRIVDAASGAPLAGRQVWVRLTASLDARMLGRTDHEGRVRLQLEPARYHVWTGDGREPGSAPSVEWTLAGPVPAELALAP